MLGAESSRNVASGVTSHTIDGLEENASYRVAVSALIGSTEGTPATVLTRTGNLTKMLLLQKHT